jgi:hypothetical protein
VSRWAEVEASAPEFAGRVRELFQARKHKTLATLRRDGSPRISGIETQFESGDLWFGSMPESVKGQDVRRDPRVALHGPNTDPPEGHPVSWSGEAKIAGVAVEEASRFRVDVTEVVLTRLNPAGDQLVIESWHPGRGLETRTRS